MSGRMGREKGKRGEREAAKALNTVFPHLQTRRAQQYCGAAGDADIIGTEGIHVEVKRVERFHMHPALEQADNDRGPGEVPLVLTRQNGKSWIALCYLKDLPAVMGHLAHDDESSELAADSQPLDLDPKSPSQ